MIEAWFSQEAASRFAFLALLSLFALAEIPAKRGRYRGLVMGAWNTVLVFSAMLLITAALGWFSGQPGYVVSAMGGSGLVIGVSFLALKQEVVAAYQAAELRKTIAKDL